MDSVKLALGGADTAADTLVGVNYAAAAAQAAGSLGLNLFLGKGDPVIAHGKGLGLIDGRLVAGGLTHALHRQNHLGLIQLLELAQIAVDRQSLADIYIAVDGNRTLAAGSDSVDGVLQRGVDAQIFRGLRGDLVLAEQRAAL